MSRGGPAVTSQVSPIFLCGRQRCRKPPCAAASIGSSDRNIHTCHEAWQELDDNSAIAIAELQPSENKPIANLAAAAAKLQPSDNKSLINSPTAVGELRAEQSDIQ